MSASSNVLIHLHDAHKIFTAPVERRVYRAPAVRRACRYLLCVWGLLWRRSHPRQGSIHAAAQRMLWIWPWQRALTPRPEEGQETVGSWSTEVVPGTFPHASGSSSFSLVCGWSVCLHHFTPGGGRGGRGEVRGLTVEVGENFSEGIHCPLTERTA